MVQVLSLVPALERATADSQDRAARQVPPPQPTFPPAAGDASNAHQNGHPSENGHARDDTGTSTQHPDAAESTRLLGQPPDVQPAAKQPSSVNPHARPLFVRQLLVARKYIRRRIWRICPAFYATLAVVLLLIVPDNRKQDGLSEAARTHLLAFSCESRMLGGPVVIWFVASHGHALVGMPRRGPAVHG